MRNAATLAAILVLTGAHAACAGLIAEVGDAGDLPSNAQTTVGSGLLDEIEGALNGFDDADMYAVFVADPLAFSATTDGHSGGVWDTQLFLFDAQGLGVSANDDIANGNGPYNPRSRLAAGAAFRPEQAGLYYLAVSGWDRDPHSSAGPIFVDDATFVGTVGPSNVGGGLPISGWDGDGNRNGGLGGYRIRLTGAQFVESPPGGSAEIPEAGSLVFIVAGALCWGARRTGLISRI